MKKWYAILLITLLAQPILFAGKVLDINFDSNGNYISFDSHTPYIGATWAYARVYDGNIGCPSFPDFRSSMIGRALHCDGLTHINVPNNQAIDFGRSSPFSLSFWVKTGSTQGNNTVLDKRTGSGGYHVTLYNGYLLFQLNDGSNYYNYWDTTGTPSLNDNQWHHVVITVERNRSNGIKFYVDGVLSSTFNSGNVTGSISNSSSLLIGGHSETGGFRFNGELDEVAVYNTALSQSDLGRMHRVGPFSGRVESKWHKAIPSVHRSGRYAHYYTFTVDKTRAYEFNLESSTDAYLYLLSGSTLSGGIITSDDDGGTGRNSRIVRTLAPGTYTLEATTYSSGKIDDFTLTSAYPVYHEISTGDVDVTLKHLMYKKNKIFNKWETNTSFEGYEHLSRNSRNQHVFAVQHWLPHPSKVKNIVFLVAGQQGIRADRQDYPAIVTGQKKDWHHDSSISWINTWKYTKNRSYRISGRSVAGQIIADYQRNGSEYFGFSPDDTALIMLFDACFYVEEANDGSSSTSPIVQGIVDEYTNWIMSKTSIKPENIYLAGASRGGSLVTQMAYNLKHKAKWMNYTADTKIVVGCFDAVSNHKEGELWTTSTRVDNPKEWINSRFCYKSTLSSRSKFTNQNNLHLLQIAGGADVFTGTPWHSFYFDSSADVFEFQWVDRSHKDIGRDWHDDTVGEQLRWLNFQMNKLD